MQATLDITAERVGLTKDCFQTPDYATEVILPLLERDWAVLDPCCGKGNIVYCLRRNGFKAFGHDIQGESEYSPFAKADFLDNSIKYSDIDCIITNPPYSCYGEFLARCVEIGKPFALLVPDSFADSLERLKTFQLAPCDIIYPPHRIAFETPTGRTGSDSKPQMLTVWITRGLPIERLQATFGRVAFLKKM